MSTDSRTEVGALFGSREDLQAAVDRLQQAGFDRAQLTLLADTAVVEEKLGGSVPSPQILADPDAPRQAVADRADEGNAQGVAIGVPALIAAFIAAGATAAAGVTIAGAVIATAAAGGGAGIVGSALAGWIDRRQADHFDEQLKRGGILLWVTCADPTAAEKARTVIGENAVMAPTKTGAEERIEA